MAQRLLKALHMDASQSVAAVSQGRRLVFQAMAGVEEGRLGLERDLYRALIEVPSSPDPQAHLADVLQKLVTMAGAERGYVELYQDESADAIALSHLCTPEQEAEIRAVTSRGIVAAAIASGTTIHTPAALLDERFASHPSVQNQRLEAVLCVPLTSTSPGVLYLEGRRGAGPFSLDVVAVVERVARFLTPVLEASTPRADAARGLDPTNPLRSKLNLAGLAGRSAGLAYVFEQVGLVAPLDISVLVSGDSGTGKTALARAIHDNSPRRAGPFIELNCAAIPETLFEAELFGTMSGAFTGARRAAGKIEAAEGGTLLLDEIGELPFAMQSKLLQVLQSKQYYPVGSAKVATANVRVIAATNALLEELVEQKKFRDDLYYRLTAFSIRMPSLGERRADIQPLIDELMTRIAFEHRLPKLPLSRGFRAACEGLEWPGNVRQLRNRLEQSVIRAVGEGAVQVEPRHLGVDAKTVSSSLQEATRAFQRELLRRELTAAKWDTAEVAERLEISRSQVYNLIKAFALDNES